MLTVPMHDEKVLFQLFVTYEHDEMTGTDTSLVACKQNF